MTKHDDAAGDRYRRREDREKEHAKQLPGDDDPPLPPPVEPIKADVKPDRGKKYKKCCGTGKS